MKAFKRNMQSKIKRSKSSFLKIGAVLNQALGTSLQRKLPTKILMKKMSMRRKSSTKAI